MNENEDIERITKTYRHKHNWHLAEKQYSEFGAGLDYLHKVMFVCPCGKSKIVNVRK